MKIVSERERELKWKALDPLEFILIVTCGLLLTTFTFSVLINVITRLTNTPVLWLNELIVGTFVWGIFLGGSVAVRRNEHFTLASFVENLPTYWQLGFVTFIQLVMLVTAGCFAIFGYINFLQGFHNYLETTGTPIAVITASVPMCGVLTAIFSFERLVHAWKNVLFDHRKPLPPKSETNTENNSI
ncbi:TRAP transporter small permease [Salinicola halimionae]|uniref:TRAP transporter small permease n=1 Tax=Salinicola halimionae TaxID=1949081 RepID=UPI00130024C4|nr:TRAP transporter small permease [Salinicola halimionae]